jgi:hypothetical protein
VGELTHKQQQQQMMMLMMAVYLHTLLLHCSPTLHM